MLEKIRKQREQGFTIIEVMIVLAIAGLIILVVLLAVPALQRSGRNSAMKTDASAISAAITEFGTNNGGASPLAANSSFTAGTGVVSVNNATGTAATGKAQGGDTITFGQATVAAVTGVAGSIYVDYGVSCANPTITGQGTAAPTFTPTVKSARATAIIYSTELSGGLQIVCLDS